MKYEQGETILIADTLSFLKNMKRNEKIEVIYEIHKIQSNDQESVNISLTMSSQLKIGSSSKASKY